MGGVRLERYITHAIAFHDKADSFLSKSKRVSLRSPFNFIYPYTF